MQYPIAHPLAASLRSFGRRQVVLRHIQLRYDGHISSYIYQQQIPQSSCGLRFRYVCSVFSSSICPN